jgi:two-component system, sensor histidine kinase
LHAIMTPTEAPAPSGSSESLRVLVVDDHDDCREIMATMLTISGYDVISAQNGEEALEAAQRDEPFAVVTDLAMPIMDGFALEQALRADRSLQGTYVVAVSGFTPDYWPDRWRRARFDRRFTKPVNWAEVEEALNEARSRLEARQVPGTGPSLGRKNPS